MSRETNSEKACKVKYPTIKDQARQLESEIASIPYYRKEKKRLEDMVITLYARFFPSSSFPDAVPHDLEKVSGVMPKFSGGETSEIDQLDKIDQVKNRLRRISDTLLETQTLFNMADPDDKVLLERILINREKRSAVATELNMSRPALNRKVTSILVEILKNRTLYGV